MADGWYVRGRDDRLLRAVPTGLRGHNTQSLWHLHEEPGVSQEESTVSAFA